MYYDLNIPWPVALGEASEPLKKGVKRKGTGDKDVGRTDNGKQGGSEAFSDSDLGGLSAAQRAHMTALVADAAELGYNTIAFNFIVQSRFDGAKHKCKFAPSGPGQPRPPFPSLDPRCHQADASSSRYSFVAPKVLQLTRMTLVLDEYSMGKSGHGLTATNQAELVRYDLLAAQPCNDASFSSVCLAMTELKPISIDIISLDAASAARSPFFVKRSLVNTAIANGAVFEVCYSRAVSSPATGSGLGKGASGGNHNEAESEATSKDSHLRARRNIVAVTRDLLRVTNGRGIILSSGAADIMGMRGPYDVINLATVFGMNATTARDAISSTCRSLCMRAETRKTFRGVVGDAVVVPIKSTHVAEPYSASKNAEPAAVQLESNATGADVSGASQLSSTKRKQPEGEGDHGEAVVDVAQRSTTQRADKKIRKQ